jgi:hypothetical protein
MTQTDDDEPRSAEDRGYEVGHGKPPKEHRFKKGQSGNPRGRRKGSTSRRKIVHDIANEMNSVNVGGKPMRHSTIELVLMMLRNMAMNGDLRSATFVETLIDRYSSRPSDGEGAYLVVPETLSPEEWIEDAKRRNAELDKDIAASGASSFIEYLQMKDKAKSSTG